MTKNKSFLLGLKKGDIVYYCGVFARVTAVLRLFHNRKNPFMAAPVRRPNKKIHREIDSRIQLESLGDETIGNDGLVMEQHITLMTKKSFS